MTEYAWLAVYCISILVFSVSGGFVPFWGKVTHDRLQIYLSLAAGLMLGAAFFHLMPDAFDMAKSYFGWWMSLGVVGLFCIERFVAPHSHELNGGHHQHDHHHGDHGSESCCHSDVDSHDAIQAKEKPVIDAVKDRRAAAPAVSGWAAVLGLTVHTFMNGVGLAGSVQVAFDQAAKSGGSAVQLALSAFPGMAVWLAILFHKPADALAISMVLSRKGVSRQIITLVQLGFALMVPVGVIAFFVTKGAIQANMQNQLTGAALAFSSGTFLFIALSDLLPEVQFHRHDRIPLFLCLVFGVIFMGGIALLEPSKEDEDGKDAKAVEKHVAEPAGKPVRPYSIGQ
jgi:zinc and cadmium transporter